MLFSRNAGVTVLIPRGDWLVRKLIRADWMMQAADLHHILVSSMLRSERVLICGYGRSGGNAGAAAGARIPSGVLPSIWTGRVRGPPPLATPWCLATPPKKCCWPPYSAPPRRW